MPRDTVRLMLAVAAAMASVPVYFLTGTLLDHSIASLSPDVPWALVSGVFTSMFIGGCWAAIWRQWIRWTNRRRVVTAGVFVGSWLITGVTMYVLESVRRREEFTMFMPLAGVAGTLFAIVWVWRETAAEHRDRLKARTVPCPTCGYNLAGLKQTCCPECGAGFTVDQIAGLRGSAADDAAR